MTDVAVLLAEVKAALQAAHALPWRDLHTGRVVNEEDREVPVSFDDSRLIAEAPEWLGALVQVVEDQQRELESAPWKASYQEAMREVAQLRADGQRLRDALSSLRDAAMTLATTTGEFDTIHSTFTMPTEFLDNLREPLNAAADALRGTASGDAP